MTRTTAAKVTPDLPDAVVRASTQKERVPIRSGRKVVAAVVPVEDLRLLEELEDRFDVEEAERRRQSPQKPIPYETVRRRLGLK